MSEDSTSYNRPKDVDFGLPQIHLKPLSKKKEASNLSSSSPKGPLVSAVPRSKRNNSALAVGILLLLVVVVASVYYAYDQGYLFQPKQIANESNIPPAISESDAENSTSLDENDGWNNQDFTQSDSAQENNQSDSSEIIETIPSEIVEVVPNNAELSEILSPSGKYHIIVASVPSVELAREDGNKLLAGDVSIAILYPRAGRNENYRISAASFATLDEATNQLNFYRQKYGESVWVLRY
jgi:cytoskeletal protein RodZ